MTSKNHGRVSKRRRATAVTVLTELSTDPDQPGHVRALSARALLADGRAQAGDESDLAGEPAERPTIVYLPDNGRNPELTAMMRQYALERLELGEIPGVVDAADTEMRDKIDAVLETGSWRSQTPIGLAEYKRRLKAVFDARDARRAARRLAAPMLHAPVEE